MSIKSWLAKNTSSLKGKIVCVSGTTGGLGGELCRYLASLGASLILLDRNSERSKAHRDELKRLNPDISVECVRLDLENIYAARGAVEILKEMKIDVFIHNAGAYSIPRHKTSCGYDNVFQINFATPYYIIKELLPTLRERQGRVVVVGSIAHRYSKTRASDVDFSSVKAASRVYGNAKRYLMFSLFELFKNETQVTLSVVHPGITLTNITAHYPKVVFAIIKYPMKLIFMSPRKAALSLLVGAFEKTDRCMWLGPRVLDIWGLPVCRRLRGVSEGEIAYIYSEAERVYERCRTTANGMNLQGE